MKPAHSLLENLDPRSKILAFLAIVFCMVLTPITRLKDFELYFLLILILGFLSKVTPAQVLRKVFILIPFVLFIGLFVPFLKEGHECCSIQILGWKLGITHEGIWTFFNIIVKMLYNKMQHFFAEDFILIYFILQIHNVIRRDIAFANP